MIEEEYTKCIVVVRGDKKYYDGSMDMQIYALIKGVLYNVHAYPMSAKGELLSAPVARTHARWGIEARWNAEASSGPSEPEFVKSILTHLKGRWDLNGKHEEASPYQRRRSEMQTMIKRASA